MDSVYYNTANHFYYWTDSLNPNRTRYLYSDSTVYDPLAPSAAGTLSSNLPLTSFAVGNFIPLALETPDVAVSVSESQLQLSWNRIYGAVEYHIFATTDPLDWPDTPMAITTNTSLPVSPADSLMFFKVKAVNNPRRGLRAR